MQRGCDLSLVEFLSGDHDLEAVADLKLLHQRRHVVLDGLVADLDRCRNLLVGLAPHQQAYDLLFANTQDHGFSGLAPQRGITQAGDNSAGEALGYVGFSDLNRGDGLDQFGSIAALEHIAAGAGVERPDGRVDAGRSSKGNDLGRRRNLDRVFDRTVDVAGYAEIDDGDLRLIVPAKFDDIIGRRSRSNNFKARSSIQ